KDIHRLLRHLSGLQRYDEPGSSESDSQFLWFGLGRTWLQVPIGVGFLVGLPSRASERLPCRLANNVLHDVRVGFELCRVRHGRGRHALNDCEHVIDTGVVWGPHWEPGAVRVSSFCKL